MSSSIKPTIIKRENHSISRKEISREALKVLYRLNECGYEAYLVGGCVRDLLLGHHPKDFDVATNAHPEQIRSIFSNCRLIGRRFRLAHIHFRGVVIEVATFRAAYHEDHHTQNQHGFITRDNVYGTVEEDAFRRDFTINALYYNIADFSLVDFMGGVKDLKKGIIRMIGDPEARYQEDPVRLLRAARFAAKLNMKLHRSTRSPIAKMSDLLYHVSHSRLCDEVIKLFHTGHAFQSYTVLKEYGLFATLFPETNRLMHKKFKKSCNRMFEQFFKNTDERFFQGKTLSVVFLYAILLWPVFQHRYEQGMKHNPSPEEENELFYSCCDEVIKQQNKITAISRKLSYDINTIWDMQFLFFDRTFDHASRLVRHGRFRSALDLLYFRSIINPKLKKLYEWWSDFSEADTKLKSKMADAVKHKHDDEWIL